LGFGDFGAVAEPFTGTLDDELGFGAFGFGFRMFELSGSWPGLWFRSGLNTTDAVADFFDHGGAFHKMIGCVGLVHEDKFGSLIKCFRTEQFKAWDVFKYR